MRLTRDVISRELAARGAVFDPGIYGYRLGDWRLQSGGGILEGGKVFRTNSQLALFCESIVRTVGLEGIFTGANGGEVTAKGLKLWKRNGMSHGEQLMFRLAKDIWNGDGKTPVSEMISTLDGSNLRAVAEVFLALADNSGGRGADEFIERHLSRMQGVKNG